MLPAQSVVACLRFHAFCKMPLPGMFSFACQKRTRKAPATFEAREARTRGCSPLVTPKLLGSIQKIQAAALEDFLCSADFESLARRAVRASLCSVCCANASAGSRRCKMPLPATTLSREKRKPEIRRFPAFIPYERIVPLNMARAISGGHSDRGTQRCARRLYPALFL